MIVIDEFRRVEIRVGKIVECEKVEGADKLLKLQVDFGDFGKRQIVSAIAEYYKPEDLVGKLLPFVVNLEPRIFRGVESQGMLMAAEGKDRPVLLEPSEDLPEGAVVV
jgi:methionyl-tRNA synthetase